MRINKNQSLKVTRATNQSSNEWAPNRVMAELPVPKEYVRQQLQSMGLKDISEEDLEAYTRDFSRLIQDHLEHDSSSSASSLDVSPHVGLQQHNSSHNASSSPAIEVHTPLTTYHVPPPGSAVFKTFPGDKENRIQYLSPSVSPKLSPRPPRQDPNSSLQSTSNVRGPPPNAPLQRVGVKRKVLRKCNGESRVFDESLSESGSPQARDLSARLSDLSVTSVTSTDTSSSSESRGGVHIHLPSSTLVQHHRPLGNKSFIRPATTHPHTRGLKKCDPVARYHEFRKLWENFQPPGEKDRSSLRWQIREQLMHQDMPPYEPKRRTLKPNEFVVPTEKKRLALRWEIRHSLEQT